MAAVPARKRLLILGSTGSIGTQALDVVRNHREEYDVVALAAARNGELLAAQAEEFGVPLARARLCADTPEVLTELASAPEVDVVLNAVVGFAGLLADARGRSGTARPSRSPTRRA